ncbi:MAG: NusG domain II-containing protein [Clostridiales bacterium]|nr:NusG domain II-containing protein [Clostridiales bacterium]
MQILKKTDIAVICFFVISAVVLIFIFAIASTRDGAVAAVFVEGTEVLAIDLAQNEGEVFEIISPNGVNKVLVERGAVRMIYADCPNLHCLRAGAISGTFQTITCLPNRVIVEIRGGADEVDIVAQ